MERLNVVGLDTRFGFRTVELIEGDLVDLLEPVDVLVISAFAGGYHPLPGTALGALSEQHGIDVGRLAQRPAIDLREPLQLWLSYPLDSGPAKRIVCVELRGTGVHLEDVLQNVFASLLLFEAKGVAAKTIVMPLLGTGHQKLPPLPIAGELITGAHRYLARSASTVRIQFVEKDPEKARTISEAMDAHLGRSRVSLPQDQLANSLRQDLRNRFVQARELFEPDCLGLWNEWIRLLQASDVRSAEFGVASRKLVETVLTNLTVPQQHLFKRIKAFEDTGQAAPWICGYMHVLRHLGNESAHEHSAGSVRRPPAVEAADLIAGLICVERILEFWIGHGQSEPGA